MKPITKKLNVLFLSDLWGWRDNFYLDHFKSNLAKAYNIIYYDSTELAEIPHDNLSQEELHNAFLTGGIDKAVTNLINMDNDVDAVIGVSIGGSIGWKYLKRLDKQLPLFAISATRLRYEIDPPNFHVYLHYGINDPNKPGPDWSNNMKIPFTLIEGFSHNLYKDEVMINKFCLEIDEILRIET